MRSIPDDNRRKSRAVAKLTRSRAKSVQRFVVLSLIGLALYVTLPDKYLRLLGNE